MYSPAFDYHRASSLADAHRLLAAHPGAKLLAGGHSLIPLLKLRLASPAAVIDIGRVDELRGITESGNHVRIGALTTHAEVASSSVLQSIAPALTDAAGLVGDPAVRNRGTVGGNIAHADPASDLPTALVALGADIVLARKGAERTIAAEIFFTGIMTTALEEHEIILAVLIPAGGAGRGSAYVKFSHRRRATRWSAPPPSSHARPADVRLPGWPWAGWCRTPHAAPVSRKRSSARPAPMPPFRQQPLLHQPILVTM
jgi:aerobic carbon-monoxide dehydrogenase medium subunit